MKVPYGLDRLFSDVFPGLGWCSKSCSVGARLAVGVLFTREESAIVGSGTALPVDANCTFAT